MCLCRGDTKVLDRTRYPSFLNSVGMEKVKSGTSRRCEQCNNHV
jgi:hypothetical protein